MSDVTMVFDEEFLVRAGGLFPLVAGARRGFLPPSWVLVGTVTMLLERSAPVESAELPLSVWTSAGTSRFRFRGVSVEAVADLP
jgi:hypothetical protein